MTRAIAVAIVIVLAALGGIARSDEGTGLTVHVRFTNRRAAKPVQYIAGEHVPLGVRITGLQTNGEGEFDLLANAELLDGNGRTIVPIRSERLHNKDLRLGGRELNFGRSLILPADCVGKHVLRVSVKDQLSGQEATAELNLEVADGSTFGIMNLRTALDQKAELQTDIFPVGRTMFVPFVANGCADQDGQVHVECEGNLTDLDGRPLASEPIRLSVKPEPSVYGTTGQANAGLYMSLNRSGQFMLKVKIKDAISGKEAEQVLPIVVVGQEVFPIERTAAVPSQTTR